MSLDVLGEPRTGPNTGFKIVPGKNPSMPEVTFTSDYLSFNLLHGASNKRLLLHRRTFGSGEL